MSAARGLRDERPDDRTREQGPAPEAAPHKGIALTEAAAKEVLRIIAGGGPARGHRARVGAMGGGCSGFSYVLDFDHKGKTEFDIEHEAFGVRVLIDKKSEFFMSGTTIDFNNGLLNRGFVFKNPMSSGPARLVDLVQRMRPAGSASPGQR
ncbi:MAG: iron-sulfur cluster assembly accessory protein [Planctomycetota bacterium]